MCQDFQLTVLWELTRLKMNEKATSVQGKTLKASTKPGELLVKTTLKKFQESLEALGSKMSGFTLYI